MNGALTPDGTGPHAAGGILSVCGRPYRLLKRLGHGKGGYSYLAEPVSEAAEAVPGGKASFSRAAEIPALLVLKQIHHEPCDYYAFGNKIEAERADYARLAAAGIRMPALLALDAAAERLIKTYIDGPTVFELVRDGAPIGPYLAQVREMAAQAKAAGLNIDYFPTNFAAERATGLLYYIDYECNPYEETWDLEHWGLRYWSRTPDFEAYLASREKEAAGRSMCEV